MSKKLNSAYYGAAFLMATSAIGPGFLTSTTIFTSKLLASFGFAILLSIIVDIVAQLNVWRIITETNKPAQDIANELRPGLGNFLSFLIISRRNGFQYWKYSRLWFRSKCFVWY